MSRADYDDIFFRAMREHDEARSREAAWTQRILMGATVAYSLLTLLMAAAVCVQAWAAWKQTQRPQQIVVPASIVNVPPTPAPVVNVTIPVPTVQPTRSR